MLRHTGTADDRSQGSAGVLNDLGSQGAPVLSSATVPDCQNCNSRSVDTAGRLLLEMCAATSCVLLNGRCDGDLQGAYTFRSYGLRSSRGACSVVDYGVVSECLFPSVQSFKLVSCDDVADTSDHNALVCTITVPSLPVGRFSTQDICGHFSQVGWCKA